jgi:hypothetical protein
MAKNKTITFAPIEKEVIFLKAVNELINSMVNSNFVSSASSGERSTGGDG